MESPDKGRMPYFDEEMGALVGTGFEGTRALLVGHRLYIEWAACRPTATDGTQRS